MCATNSRCSSLTNITIPNSVTEIGYGTFEYCTSLTEITIPNSVTKIESAAFKGCTSLTEITIPNSVTVTGSSVFSGCSSLTRITISNRISWIESETFSGCTSLKNITIPNSVTKIKEKAFYGCRNLTNVYCYADKIPDTNSESFKDSYIEYCTLYVPESAIDLYKSVSPWSSFGTIKSIESSDITLINIKAKAMTYNLNGSIQNEKTNGFNIILNSNGNSQKVFVR